MKRILVSIFWLVGMTTTGVTFAQSNPPTSPPAPTVIASETDHNLEEIQINDNRKQAGELREGVYYLNLEIREGNWYPETKAGAPMKIKALAEAGKPLSVPGPLMRVPEGTEVKLTVTNRIKDQPQELIFFASVPPNDSDKVVILPGQTTTFSFKADTAATYVYAAGDYVSKGLPPLVRNQAYGAFIVDAKGELPDPDERIFVIGVCETEIDSSNRAMQFVINGMSWPFTERLQYRQNQKVKWQVINATPMPHPMHLHGFPFTVHNLWGGSLEWAPPRSSLLKTS